ncbi:hypothetical protein ENSA5_27030 [Enhygromyxa salina]|uniref:HEAT repeat protein n=1 Tax=Enhygromyxa salina TaxID=215803 RepID=A0A2S9Y7L8_9BACT|nr:hypothetical protein [Enhygromyxa salina]PRQ01021.1 hypothetical protein ENSA5_27030 [Enhygromyxa salina]
MTKKKVPAEGPVTAEELVERLHADPDWLRRREEKRREVMEYQAELRKAELPVIEDLKAVGIEVNRLWDLQSLDEPYPEAFPILLDHFQRPHRGEVHEDIGRAFGVREAWPLWPTLVELYEQATDKHAQDGMAVALSTIGKQHKELLDDVLALVKDPSNGPSRVLLIDVLSGSREPRAYEALVEMRDDPDLYKEVEFRLKRKERDAKYRAKRRQAGS